MTYHDINVTVDVNLADVFLVLSRFLKEDGGSIGALVWRFEVVMNKA